MDGTSVVRSSTRAAQDVIVLTHVIVFYLLCYFLIINSIWLLSLAKDPPSAPRPSSPLREVEEAKHIDLSVSIARSSGVVPAASLCNATTWVVLEISVPSLGMQNKAAPV